MNRLMAGLWLLLAGACIHGPSSAAKELPATLRVENHAFLDMNIFVLKGAERIRLGMATGNSTTVLKIPASLLFGSTTLRFQAKPIGGSRQPISEEITVEPGDEVTIMIPPS